MAPTPARLYRTATFALLAATLVATSCARLPSYRLMAQFPHKDVVQLTVFLEAPIDVEGYRRIANVEIERFRGILAAPPTPLYEFRVDFHEADSPFERFASVTVSRESGFEPGPVELAPSDMEVYVY